MEYSSNKRAWRLHFTNVWHVWGKTEESKKPAVHQESGLSRDPWFNSWWLPKLDVQLLPAFHFVLFQLIPSLVPRPRPAFHCLQYGKAGRVWYLFSREQDILENGKNFQKAGQGLGTELVHTIKHGKFSGMRWYAGVATNITCRSVYDQVGSKIIVVKRYSWLPWLPPSEVLDGLTHSEDTPFQSLPRLTSNSHFGWSLS